MNGEEKQFVFVHGHDLGEVAKTILQHINKGFTCLGSPFVLRDGAVCQAMYSEPDGAMVERFQRLHRVDALARSGGEQ